jgi:tetratricopeptide (TPR) repeat protein/transcriptional regulator with XRE-family HTH domain
VNEHAGPGFAGLLRQLREEAQLTQEELAEAAGLSPRTVSDLERGVNRTARKDTAALLAGALGLEGPVRGTFIAAARGRASAAEVLAARADAPVGLAAVALEGLPGPAAAPMVVPRELPADVVGFTGRKAELAELDWLLPETTEDSMGPVVISALSGTAGVGKTALAVRWAHRMAGSFPDGQLYVNLRGYDPDQPVSAGEALAWFLGALGVPDIPPGEAERAARFRSLVAGRRLLVVLDNAASVEQVRPLLPGAGPMVVVTSRDALAGLVARDGAQRLDLDLLPAADAVELLRSLIGARAHADAAAVSALAELCARLPLALRVAAELAVSRPGTPLAELVAELAAAKDRLELLDAGGDPRGAVASVFSWSYRHLAADAARMFRLLGLHPGPDFDRYAAAALAGVDVAEAGRLLSGLARAHLIQLVNPGRYGMHDLLRAYAAHLATTHDTDEDRHAGLTGLFAYYLAACATAMDSLAPARGKYRPDPPPARVPVPDFADLGTARAWLDTELATLTGVAAHAASHGWPGHTIRLAATILFYLYGGHNVEGLTICGHALSAARSCGDRATQAHALTSLGNFQFNLGRHEEAIGCHEQALALALEIGDQLAQARALNNLGEVYERQGRYQQAADCYQQSLSLDRELNERVGEAIELANAGGVYIRQGRYPEASSYLRQALALAQETGDRATQALALVNLGEVCNRQGDDNQAAGHLRQALAISREIGDRSIEAAALTRLGEVCNRQGDYNQAAGCHQQALTLNREIGAREAEADALNGAGETLLATGQPDQARACHTTALALTRQTGNRSQQARALTRLAAVCREQGDHDQAAACDQEALTLYQEIGDLGGQADALNGAGETLLATGEPAKAHDRHTAALSLARQTGDPYQQARAHHGLAGACHGSGAKTVDTAV